MKERSEYEENLPDDAVLFEHLGDWLFYWSEERKRLYINTASYHPKPLCLEVEDLRGMAEMLDKWSPEIRARSLERLEGMDDFATQLELAIAKAGTRKLKPLGFEIGGRFIPFKDPEDDGKGE